MKRVFQIQILHVTPRRSRILDRNNPKGKEGDRYLNCYCKWYPLLDDLNREITLPSADQAIDFAESVFEEGDYPNCRIVCPDGSLLVPNPINEGWLHIAKET